jgi:hypothetical protein
MHFISTIVLFLENVYPFHTQVKINLSLSLSLLNHTKRREGVWEGEI